jgi:hypothetical protein
MLALTLITAYTAAPARAGDDETQNGDEEEGDFIDKAFRGVLNGIGLKNTTAPGINYHERSPLVVPPTRDLPPPQKATRAAPDPAWPQDRDMNPKKVAKKKESKPAQRTASGGAAPDTTGEQLTPGQLGFKGFDLGKMFDRTPEEIPFSEEPSRGALTDPPEGLRTPSPKYSYGTKNKMEPDKNSPADQAVGSSNQ